MVQEQETHFDKDGNVMSFTRAARRRKPPTENKYTKATHKIKKERLKNAPTKHQRETAALKARKARRESYSQVS